MTVYYFKHYLEPVTTFYIGILIDALRLNGYNIVELDDINKKSLSQCKRTDWFILTHHKDVVRLYFKGYRNVINWFQGIYPEEDYMMRGNRLRFLAFNLLERFNLKHTSIGLFVSRYQIEHYLKKWKSIPSQRMIIPCFNDTINKDSFFTEDKYSKNVFCYAGSLYKWQCFEETIAIYKMIEEKYGDRVHLNIYTKETEKAKNLVDAFSISNYSISYVPQEELHKELARCKYGFIIREDNIVNNVATPTKMGNYLSNGIIPIITPSVYSFRDIAEKYSHIIVLNDVNNIGSIEQSMQELISPEELYEEYSHLFSQFYNRDYYVEKLREFLVLE